MNDSRQQILGRIRDALSIPAEQSGGHDHSSPAALTPAPGEHPVSDWLPLVGSDFASRVELFRKNSKELTTDFRLVDSMEALHAELASIAQAEGWKQVATHACELTGPATTALGLPILRTDCGYDTAELERCDAGITACDALIAQTGSVLVTSKSAGGRALSVLPPHHVVIARRNQLAADLTEAYAIVKARYAPDYPSMISVITGPSRTGDIERILVLGAHGPKKLTVLCV